MSPALWTSMDPREYSFANPSAIWLLHEFAVHKNIIFVITYDPYIDILIIMIDIDDPPHPCPLLPGERGYNWTLPIEGGGLGEGEEYILF